MLELSDIAIVYYTKSGSTAVVVDAIIEGIADEGIGNTQRLLIKDSDIQNGRFINQKFMNTLVGAKAIVFGSPTYMGSVTAQFKAFADATSDLWSDGLLRNKFVSGFTTGSSLYGDTDNTLHYLFVLAQQHGMAWVGMEPKQRENNRHGTSVGLIAQNKNGVVNKTDLTAAKHLGQRIARWSKTLVPE